MNFYVPITASLIRYVKRTCHTILSSLNSPAKQLLSILTHTRHNFGKYIENMRDILIFSATSSKTFLTLRRAERYSIKRVHKSIFYT
jgi:hypothetical protein